MTEAEHDERDGSDGRPGPMAVVSHAHPETREAFGAVYRRGPAVTDGGAPRTNGARSAGAADGAGRTIADVDHEPPYPEPADVWSRGGVRSRADGAGGDA